MIPSPAPGGSALRTAPSPCRHSPWSERYLDPSSVSWTANRTGGLSSSRSAASGWKHEAPVTGRHA
eukprot:5106141-Pyramimonas_sp.AAC.1